VKEQPARGEKYEFAFEAYGVKVCIQTSEKFLTKNIESRIEAVLPNGVDVIKAAEAEHFIYIQKIEKDKFAISKDGEFITDGATVENVYDLTESQIRLLVAEFAVGRVFLHAGAVGWQISARRRPDKKRCRLLLGRIRGDR
jgi:hypothetical protein